MGQPNWAGFAWFQTSWSIGFIHMYDLLKCYLPFELLIIGHQAGFGFTTICLRAFIWKRDTTPALAYSFHNHLRKNNSGIGIYQFELLLVAISFSLILTTCAFYLLQELADHTAEVNIQHETLDGMFTFYDSISGRLHIYQVRRPLPLLSPCHHYLPSTHVYNGFCI